MKICNIKMFSKQDRFCIDTLKEIHTCFHLLIFDPSFQKAVLLVK